MNHLGTQRLESERLLLRPFVWGEREAMFRNWESDPEVTKYLCWQCCTSERNQGYTSVYAILADDWRAGRTL